MPNKVFIVGPDGSVTSLFRRWGWEITKSMAEADLVQFTGGQDIDPRLYNQERHKTTYFTPERDRMELAAFELAKHLQKQMAGICRGGQLLNVLAGGSMWQDVNNHVGSHWCYDTLTGEGFHVSSVHHQMMIPGPTARIVLEAKESTRKEKMGPIGSNTMSYNNGFRVDGPDPELIYYPEEHYFCFQGHPEYGTPDVDTWYMGYLDELMGFRSVKS